MRYRTLTTAILALLSSVALAQENDTGLYLGAGVGRFDVEIDDVDALGSTVESFDSDDTSWKIFAGWRFLPFLAVEVDYIDFGKPEDRIGDVDLEAELSGVAPYVIGTLPLGPIELFAKAGYYFYDLEVSGRDVVSVDESDEDFVYGGGVGLTLFDHLHARLEYELIDVSRVEDANALWLSGAWRF